MLSCNKFRELFLNSYKSAYDWDLYWESQYALYASGYTGPDLHDVTLEIMGRA